MLLGTSVCIKKLICPDNSRKQKAFSCKDVAAFYVVFYRKSCEYHDIQICLTRCVISQSMVSIGKERKVRYACVSLHFKLYNRVFSASIHSFLAFVLFLTKLGSDRYFKVPCVFTIWVFW